MNTRNWLKRQDVRLDFFSAFYSCFTTLNKKSKGTVVNKSAHSCSLSSSNKCKVIATGVSIRIISNASSFYFTNLVLRVIYEKSGMSSCSFLNENILLSSDRKMDFGLGHTYHLCHII